MKLNKRIREACHPKKAACHPKKAAFKVVLKQPLTVEKLKTLYLLLTT